MTGGVNTARSAVVAIALLGVALGLGGCTTYDDEYGPGRDDQDQGSVEEIPEPPAAAPTWSCYYDVTYNHNWHDDVLCSNGTQHIRPTLRRGDNFVTYNELMASAAKYEAKLNAGN